MFIGINGWQGGGHSQALPFLRAKQRVVTYPRNRSLRTTPAQTADPLSSDPPAGDISGLAGVNQTGPPPSRTSKPDHNTAAAPLLAKRSWSLPTVGEWKRN